MSDVDAELAAVLGEFGLGGHAVAIGRVGIYSLRALLTLSSDADDEVLDALQDDNADRKCIRNFRDWLRKKRKAPPGRFTRMASALNDTDLSQVGATTLLRVHVNPLPCPLAKGDDMEGGAAEAKVSLRIAPGAVEKHVQVASGSYVPVISLVGPTGAGKSFLVNLFLEEGSPQSHRPVVAGRNQHIPTSANVTVHRGVVQHIDMTNPRPGLPVLLADFEGEDGRTPKNLQEGYLRRLTALAASASTFTSHVQDDLEKWLEETASQRQSVVKEVLPCLAYMISDVLLFVDQVEPRRTERRDRIRDFALQAHKAVESFPWRPALVIVQNKWCHDPSDPAQFDITSEYDWLVESLATVFTCVKVVRVPFPTAGYVFEFGVQQLHKSIYEVLQDVREVRGSIGCLHSELDFWFGFETLMSQLEQRGAIQAQADAEAEAQTEPQTETAAGTETETETVTETGIDTNTNTNTNIDIEIETAAATVAAAATDKVRHFVSLSTTLSHMSASQNAADNVTFAFKLLGPKPKRSAEFSQRVAQILEWYAYGLAGQARFQGGDAQQIREGLRVLCAKLMEQLRRMEPCTSTLSHGGRLYRCTQRRAGHTAGHRNPATIAVESESWLQRMLWVRDLVPCSWPGDFEGCDSSSVSTLEDAYDRFTEQMSVRDYEKAFAKTVTGKRLQLYRRRNQMGGVCFLCLRAAKDLIALPNPDCHHYLCRRCILMRQRLSSGHPGDREVVCPFCCQKSELPAEPEHGRLRVLSLDAGGLRGLVLVRLLQRLESRFAPLSIASLFDLIVGVDTGALVSMALLCERPLVGVEACLKKLAGILDVTLPFHHRLWRLITDSAAYDSKAMMKAIHESLGETWFEDKCQDLPCCCCLLAQEGLSGVRVAGNFPKQLLAKKNIPIYHAGPVDAMAYAATAVPTHMDAQRQWVEVSLDRKGETTQRSLAFESEAREACCQADINVNVNVNVNTLVLTSFKNAVIEACCPVKHAALMAEQMQQVYGLGDTMEMLVSLGTGKPRLGTTVASMPRENLVDCGSHQIDMAASAEEEWKAFVEETRGRAGLRQTPLIRLSPPDLGAAWAFSGQAVPEILSGLDKYMDSSGGSAELEQLFHLTYAKLWEVDGLSCCSSSSMAGGDPRECRLKLRDLRFKFEDLGEEKLYEVIATRQTTELAVLQQTTPGELVETARSAFAQQPFQPPMEGHFAYILDGQDHDLDMGVLSFTLEAGPAKMPMLEVVWRTERFGDFPVSGFPRLLRAREDASG